MAAAGMTIAMTPRGAAVPVPATWACRSSSGTGTGGGSLVARFGPAQRLLPGSHASHTSSHSKRTPAVPAAKRAAYTPMLPPPPATADAGDTPATDAAATPRLFTPTLRTSPLLGHPHQNLRTMATGALRVRPAGATPPLMSSPAAAPISCTYFYCCCALPTPLRPRPNQSQSSVSIRRRPRAGKQAGGAPGRRRGGP